MNDQDDESWKNLPIEEQINHKLWKARLHAYQNLLANFKQGGSSILSPSNELFKYWDDSTIYAKLITDSNVAAQEVAIQSFKQLCDMCIPHMNNLDDYNFIEQHLQNWLLPLINKGLTSARSLTVQNSMDCILSIVSMDKNIYTAINSLLPNFTAKIPKQLLQTLLAVNKLLSNFKLVHLETNQIQQLLTGLSGPIVKLSSHADPKIRTNTMQLINILFNLLGRDRELLDSIIIDKLKNMQQRELNKLFEKEFKFDDDNIILFENDRRNKLERGMQNELDGDGDTYMDLSTNDIDNADNNNLNTATNINKLDLLPMESILNELPENFNSRIQDDKWKERVEVLTELNDNIIKRTKRFNDNEDYSHLINQLTDIVSNDVNLQCVSLSVEILNQFLNKSKKQQYMIFIIFNKILDRTKEKKKNVIDGIVNLLHDCCKIISPLLHDEMFLEIIKRFADKIPQVRLEMIKLLIFIICEHDDKGDTTVWGIKYKKQLNQIWQKYGNAGSVNILDSIWHVLNDQQPNIREESFTLVSELIKLIGYDKFQDMLDKLDKIKRKKIETKLAQFDKNKSNSGSNNTTTTTTTRSAIGSSNKFNNRMNNNNAKVIPIKRLATSPLKNSGSPIQLSQGIELNGSNKLRNEKITVSKPNLSHSVTNNNNNKQTIARPTNLNSHINTASFKGTQSRLAGKTTMTSLSPSSNIDNNNNNRNDKQLHNKITELEETVKIKDAEIIQLRNRLTELEKTLKIRETELKNLQITSHSNNIVSPINSSSSMVGINGASQVNTGNTSYHRNGGNDNKEGVNLALPTQKRDSISDDLPNRVNDLSIVTTEESWQRAAEVTRQLKERIERMKRRR